MWKIYSRPILCMLCRGESWRRGIPWWPLHLENTCPQKPKKKHSPPSLSSVHPSAAREPHVWRVIKAWAAGKRRKGTLFPDCTYYSPKTFLNFQRAIFRGGSDLFSEEFLYSLFLPPPFIRNPLNFKSQPPNSPLLSQLPRLAPKISTSYKIPSPAHPFLKTSDHPVPKLGARLFQNQNLLPVFFDWVLRHIRTGRADSVPANGMHELGV